MITSIEIKNKLKEKGYKGKLPIKKQDLLDLYKQLYGELNEYEIMSTTSLKKKLKSLGYDDVIPNEKDEIIKLINKLESNKNFLTFDIFENKDFNKFLTKVSKEKLNGDKVVTLDKGIELLTQYTPNLQIVTVQLNTSTKNSTFTCLNPINEKKPFIFLISKDNVDTFDFVKLNDKIIIERSDIPDNVYSKLLEQCNLAVSTPDTNENCDAVLTKLKVNYTVENMTGDGNCFYRFVAAALQLNNYQIVRQRFADTFSDSDWDIMNALFGFKLKRKQIFSKQDYIDKLLLKDSVWVPDSIIELLFNKAFPGTTIVLFNTKQNSCNLVCPLLTTNQYYIFGRYQHNLHYDLYKIDGKTKLTWDEIPKSLQEYMLECKNFSQEQEKKVETKEEVIDEISKLTVNEIKLLFQEKKYIGKLPVHKKALIELYKDLFSNKNVKDVEDVDTLEYDSMSLPEIMAELKKQNITKNLPRKKDLLIKLLKAPKCNPLQNQWCQGDLMCDVMNNICIDETQIKGNVVQETIGDHKISGSKSIVNELKTKIKPEIKTDSTDSQQGSITLYDKEFKSQTISVQNKTELINYLKTLQSKTLSSNFNIFLKTVL